jgi:hypothetical protein
VPEIVLTMHQSTEIASILGNNHPLNEENKIEILNFPSEKDSS